ncbi:hypothetical protein LZT07_13655 [Vibrio fluvialis]|uniref:hypothetical protein n=1 Tax=Vibrio fluvialis TaxID=676 RepID=UPI001F1D100B|nr:hypothetical protein [Vibrio fluvialis]MCE7638365.1 hypothetical protein [Vibrio fluvialis]
MLIGIDTYEGIETVGELIEVLSGFNPDLPLSCELESSISVSLMADYDTREAEHVDISGE